MGSIPGPPALEADALSIGLWTSLSAELDTSRTTLISSTIAQGGGDDGEQWSAEGEAERRNAVELKTNVFYIEAHSIGM